MSQAPRRINTDRSLNRPDQAAKAAPRPAAGTTGTSGAYYGERCVEYFAGKAGLLPYRLLYVAVLLVAPVLALDLVWKVADILNALMAIPNLTAVNWAGPSTMTLVLFLTMVRPTKTNWVQVLLVVTRLTRMLALKWVTTG